MFSPNSEQKLDLFCSSLWALLGLDADEAYILCRKCTQKWRLAQPRLCAPACPVPRFQCECASFCLSKNNTPQQEDNIAKKDQPAWDLGVSCATGTHTVSIVTVGARDSQRKHGAAKGMGEGENNKTHVL